MIPTASVKFVGYILLTQAATIAVKWLKVYYKAIITDRTWNNSAAVVFILNNNDYSILIY